MSLSHGRTVGMGEEGRGWEGGEGMGGEERTAGSEQPTTIPALYSSVYHHPCPVKL